MRFLDRIFGKKQSQYQQPLIVYGLCGPIGVGAHKSGEAFYWTASVILSAWHEENSEEVHVEKIRLEKESDEDGVHALQQQLKANTIFHAKVRPCEAGLELLELLDPDCEDALLQQYVPKELPQKKTVKNEGTLTFGKEEILLKQTGEEAMHLFYKLKKRQAGWRNDAIKCIGDTFVSEYNESQEKENKLTRKELGEIIQLQTITLSEDGKDAFVFHFQMKRNGKAYHFHVKGTISNGFSDCQWECENE